jgi:hypothetical protein
MFSNFNRTPAICGITLTNDASIPLNCQRTLWNCTRTLSSCTCTFPNCTRTLSRSTSNKDLGDCGLESRQQPLLRGHNLQGSELMEVMIVSESLGDVHLSDHKFA